ncbi:methyl-accepting chemotaxis protein [sulfur-oxidizing endosymbiont of Gigantopelta aegis]|uniref:methyl-accepting chemotaxis protein n=1 Tax=sulfur-oxidizing endosymbiont of Gigantopelta aegis TaxID=2794934 RepID=UPI0018DC9E38|nr:methyl-accepting chemotaxis protein [sulfur-oxidizing endosymbiont of Gigantopelta aegis]
MLTIKQKFIFASALTLVSMIGILLLGQFTVHKLEIFDKVSLEITKVQAGMLMLRRNEKDFLARNDIKYKDKFEKNFSNLVNDQVKELTIAVDNAGLDTSSVVTIKDSFNQYRNNFLELISIQQKIGLHPKDGLYGLLRKSVHQVESEIKTLSDAALRADMLQLRRNEKDFMLRLDLKYLAKFEKNVGVFSQTLEKSNYSDAVKEKLKALMASYKSEFTNFVNNSKIKGLNSKEGLLGAMRASVHDSETILEKLSQELNATIKEEVGDLDNFILTTNIIGIALALLVMFVLAWLANGILKPMHSLAKTMNQATTENNLSLRVEVESEDEIGQTGHAFNTMLERFQVIISEINSSAQQINVTSEELSKITLETHKGSQEQQVQTSEVASAIAKMKNCVLEMLENASVAADSATETKTKSRNGAEIVNASTKIINTLSDGIKNASDAINKVEQDSEQIGSVLAVIRSIAEQTNLLALNAAIEAARTGEQGRGFAVVADEVRTLAGRTQEATQEIQQMIETLQSGSKHAVKLMATSREQSNDGVEQISMVGDAILGIVSSVENIESMNNIIAASIERQSGVAEEINGNVDTIHDISLQSSHRSDETAQASDNLARLAVDLHALIEQFKV